MTQSSPTYDTKRAVVAMREKYYLACGMIHGLKWDTWTGTPIQRLQIISAGQKDILKTSSVGG
jgi:Domain of unknown function (DUF3387)